MSFLIPWVLWELQNYRNHNEHSLFYWIYLDAFKWFVKRVNRQSTAYIIIGTIQLVSIKNGYASKCNADISSTLWLKMLASQYRKSLYKGHLFNSPLNSQWHWVCGPGPCSNSHHSAPAAHNHDLGAWEPAHISDHCSILCSPNCNLQSSLVASHKQS